MYWLIFAFSGPVFWAASTHIDKYLVEKYFKNSSVAVLMVFTALIGILMLPFIWYFQPSVIHLPLANIGVMALSGMLYMGAMLFYLQALQGEEASVFAPFYQASPIFGYILAYIFLHEVLNHLQLWGFGLVIIGALMLSVNPNFTRGFKWRLLWLMLACTFTLAVSSVIFKFFAVRDEYWSTTFWTYAGEAVFGFVILAIPGYTKQFLDLFKKHPGAVLSINGANELINLAGGLGLRYALLLAPLSLVQAIGSTTSLFVFIFGIILSVFFPSLGKEDLSAKNLLQKSLSAILIAAGVVLVTH